MSSRARSDELLLASLAAGSSVEQAAQAAGLSVRTAYRRLADPAFAGRLAQARDELITNALGELVDSASGAVATLRALLEAPDERVKLGAATQNLFAVMKVGARHTGARAAGRKRKAAMRLAQRLE